MWIITFMLHSWNALVVIVINLGNRRRCRICLPEFGSALLCTNLKSTVWWKQKLKSCSSLLSSPLVLWSNSSRSSWFYLFILVFILGNVEVVLVCCQKLPQLCSIASNACGWDENWEETMQCHKNTKIDEQAKN